MTEVKTHNANETITLGQSVAEHLKPGDILVFNGDLGMGKTTFTKGLAKGIGYDEEVTSPTFALINEYRGTKLSLCHMDAYRLKSIDDVFETGFFDYIDRGWAAAVEWDENINLDYSIKVTFKYIDENTRLIRLEGKDF